MAGHAELSNTMDQHTTFNSCNTICIKYKLITNIIECLQLKSCIPKEWKDQISKVKLSASKIPDLNCLEINNKYINIDKIQCKDFYQHFNREVST